jgi:hypothetical protein
MSFWQHPFRQPRVILCTSLISRIRSLGILLLFTGLTLDANADPVEWGNLYIDTGSGPEGHSRTMPFVTPSFGMNT